MSEFAESFHQITSSIINQLIAFLQLKYHGKDEPLTTHPITMLVALSSLVVYHVLQVLLLRSPSPAPVAERFFVCSGYTVVATLAAVVFPEGASPFLYTIFGLLSAREILYMHREDESKEEDGSKFEVYKRCVCLCFEKVCFGLEKVAKFFRKETPPPKPISI